MITLRPFSRLTAREVLRQAGHGAPKTSASENIDSTYISVTSAASVGRKTKSRLSERPLHALELVLCKLADLPSEAS